MKPARSSIEVLSSAALATVQDLGRVGSFKNLKSTAPQSGCHFMAPE